MAQCRLFRQGSFILLCILPLFTGCAPYRIHTHCYATSDLEECAVRHPVYQIVPRHRHQIRLGDVGHWLTWAFFGNDDDGVFGERANYRPFCPQTYRKALSWWLRNPLHNFFFYVIGSAERINSQVTLFEVSSHGVRSLCYRPCARKVFPCKGSCFFLGFNGGKPFISLRFRYGPKYRSDFYIGWRNRGNFGLKFQPIKTISE